MGTFLSYKVTGNDCTDDVFYMMSTTTAGPVDRGGSNINDDEPITVMRRCNDDIEL